MTLSGAVLMLALHRGGVTARPQPTRPPAVKPARGVEERAVLVPYVVRHGDTLWSIAERLYGDGSKWRLIERDTVPSPDPYRLHAGQIVAVRAHSQ